MKKQKEQQSKKKMSPMVKAVMQNKAFRESLVEPSKTEDRYIITGLKVSTDELKQIKLYLIGWS